MVALWGLLGTDAQRRGFYTVYSCIYLSRRDEKMGKVNMTAFAIVFGFLIVAVLVYGGFSGWFGSGVSQSAVAPNPNPQVPAAVTGTSGQNPSVGLVFVNALTKQSVTATAINYRDASSGRLLGASPTFVQGQSVIPLINASGYIAEEQPPYTVIPGNQQIQGELYQFANETVQLYSNAGTSVIAGTGVTTGAVNDTSFTTQANHKLLLTGNTYKSSGRLFVVLETTSTTNVSSMTLSAIGSANAVASVAVPNCYTNTLSGTPSRMAWEIPAVIGGAQVQYNLQVVAANGNKVQGATYLTVYSEKDGVDSLTGAYLKSGICDSNNAFFNQDKQSFTYYYT